MSEYKYRNDYEREEIQKLMPKSDNSLYKQPYLCYTDFKEF